LNGRKDKERVLKAKGKHHGHNQGKHSILAELTSQLSRDILDDRARVDQ